MTDRILSLVSSNEEPRQGLEEWSCPVCDYRILFPVWINAVRDAGTLTGGHTYWACWKCSTKGKLRLVTAPGTEPPDLPTDTSHLGDD